MTHSEQIARHLMDFGSISTTEAFTDYRIADLRSCIDKLRRQGYKITSAEVLKVNDYGEKTPHTIYVLEGAPMSPPEKSEKFPSLAPCPFCGGSAKIVVCDDEGNSHGEEYRSNPWSGLTFAIVHDETCGHEDCPIATDEGEMLGRYTYDTEEEAADAWNRRVKEEQNFGSIR